MKNLISSYLPAKSAEEMISAMEGQISILTPFKVNLTDEEKIGARTMAEGREGYARLVSQVASAHVDSLARDQDPAELEEKLAYDSMLEKMRQRCLTLVEIISETQLANAADIMKLVDGFAASLQGSRGRNGSLDNSMKEIDEWNRRFANRKEEPTS